ncbi:PIN domain-containing protein [Kitasatospora sp. NPDC003701]
MLPWNPDTCCRDSRKEDPRAGPGRRAVLPEITVDTLDAARAVRARHRGLGLDLADAVTVALAAEYRTNAILTLDQRDFRAVRPLTMHKSFKILPHDM